MTHELKTWPNYFEDILNGRKTFEVRKNDRDFHVNDFLILEEFDPVTNRFTDRRIACMIIYILKSNEFEGISPGYAVLGLCL
jgi:ASC-1-like (ASCH) protein